MTQPDAASLLQGKTEETGLKYGGNGSVGPGKSDGHTQGKIGFAENWSGADERDGFAAVGVAGAHK
jgi:hypothetical protein